MDTLPSLIRDLVVANRILAHEGVVDGYGWPLTGLFAVLKGHHARLNRYVVALGLLKNSTTTSGEICNHHWAQDFQLGPQLAGHRIRTPAPSLILN